MWELTSRKTSCGVKRVTDCVHVRGEKSPPFALPQTERLLPFALRLFYIFIWCEKRTTNPAPHSLRRARQWQWVISPSPGSGALVALLRRSRRRRRAPAHVRRTTN